MLTELNETGFLGLYDFFYLPIDPETVANRGYAFINFIDPQSAWLFKTAYEGRKMTHFNSTKHVSVTPATLQGFDANHAHYSSARVSRGDPAARPLFLRSPTDARQQAAGGNGRRSRRRRGGCSAVDQAAKQLHVACQASSEQLQQTAVAMNVGQSMGSSTAAMNAMAAAESAMALASAMSTQGPPPRSVGPSMGADATVGNRSMKFCHFCGSKIANAGQESNEVGQPKNVNVDQYQ